MVNVLYGERISLDRKEKTDSIERQDDKLEARRVQEAKTRDIVVVGKAVDKSVSGDVDMFDRPKLGTWLTEEGREKWDELWVTTQDRLSRNDIHFLAFVFKIIEWGKTLVVLDDPTLDLLTPEGRLIAHAKAMAPARELARIKDRVADSHQKRRFTAAWPGGVPPYGYVTKYALVDGKRRKVRVLDEYMVTVLHEMRSWMVGGDTLKGVFAKLDARGELTARDRWRRAIGEPIKGERWSTSTVTKILTSPSLLGQKLHGSSPLYLPDGSPLIAADPVFDKGEWESLQAAIKKRQREPYRRYGASPLNGVTFCAKCKGSATHVVVFKENDRQYRYYRCTSQRAPKPCPQVSMRAEDVEQLVEQTFLEQAGSFNVASKSWMPGEDHTEELERVRSAIKRLENERDTAVSWDEEDEETYVERKDRLVARRNELKKKPQRSSGWVYTDTGETYRDAWCKADVQGRRQLLLDAGVRFEIHSMTEWDVLIPEDIKDRLRANS